MEEPFDQESQPRGAMAGIEPDAAADLSAVPAFLHEPEGPGPTDRERPERRVQTSGPGSTGPSARSGSTESLDPGMLPLATISPRRLLHVVVVVALAWGVISFGRQVATASAASSHADALRGANAALQGQVGAMQAELVLIQEQRYVDLQARAFRLGNPNEVPFALEANAPPLAPDAPGSASTRLGAIVVKMSPLDRWLDILFGSGR